MERVPDYLGPLIPTWVCCTMLFVHSGFVVLSKQQAEAISRMFNIPLDDPTGFSALCSLRAGT